MYDLSGEIRDFLKLLGDKTRLNILYLLAEEEHTAREIRKTLGKSQSTISQHLKLLRDAELIDSEIKENTNFYHLKDPNIIKLLESIRTFIISQKKEQLKKFRDIDRRETLF